MAEQITKSISFFKWSLDDKDKLWNAFTELTEDHLYRGEIRNAPDGVADGNVYSIQLSIGESPPVIAKIGQILVLFTGNLEVLSLQDYNMKYGASDGS